MHNEATVRRLQLYEKRIEKLNGKKMKRERLKHLLKKAGLSTGRK